MRSFGGSSTDAGRTDSARNLGKEFAAKCLEPWDILRGKDVFTMNHKLADELTDASHAHFAPNCATFSRARERPIPGAVSSPPPLRSTSEPEGLSWVFAKGGRLAQKVRLDTNMADLSANTCRDFAEKGKTFSLEHPEGSIARQLPSWKALENTPGVRAIKYHACMFAPCKRRKRQVLIHNVRGLEDFISRVCGSERICSRTGCCHLSWKPLVKSGKVVSFCTGEEREYPKEFCDALAQGIVRDYADRKSKLSFLEIFSGPNAPLTMSVAETLGVDPPQLTHSLSNKKGVTTEFRSLNELGVAAADPCSSSGLSPLEISEESFKTNQPPVESNPYRLAAVESGRQPSYGKRTSLIPDGLNSPNRHFDLARTLKHPFLEEQVVKEDHKVAIDVMKSKGASISSWRLKQLAKIKSLVDSFKKDQLRENELASWTAKQLGTKPKTVTMRKLQTEFGLEDGGVPDALLHGLPILGKAEISPFFESFDIPPQISEVEFYGSMSKRNAELIERVKFMGQKGGEALAEAIFQKTQKEVLSGTMGPARDYSYFYKKYQGVFGVVPSFGLEQGVDENGRPKYRRIDDHSASANNMVAHRLQKVPMTMVDYVAVLVKYAFAVLSCKINLATEDMKSAYRQVALLPDHVRFAII